MRLPVIAIVLLLFVGCSKTNQQETAENENQAGPKPKSTTQILIDGFTGRTAIRAGHKARKTIEKVSAEKQQNLDEILGK